MLRQIAAGRAAGGGVLLRVRTPAGYDGEQWLKLGLLVMTAQLLGHPVFNHLLTWPGADADCFSTILLEIPAHR